VVTPPVQPYPDPIGDFPDEPGGGHVEPSEVITADLSISQSYERELALITYTIVARNNGPQAAPGAIISETFPAYLHNIIWTCAGAHGASCAAGGAGYILNESLASFPAGGVVTYTVQANMDIMRESETTVRVIPPSTVTDPNLLNNIHKLVTRYQVVLIIVFQNY
jgi:uncharacterized repeat protein (TIGR01451 family)